MSEQPFDKRDELAMWLLEQGFPADFVVDYANRASPSGVIWSEACETPEVFGPPAPPPTPEQLRALGVAMEWYWEER
ncbi:MAG: hypothetical protein WKF67_08080 [Rubrobacteraceae bacterium]